ncbi:hypothetical protein, partial [Staphylococcus aureus]|uniref:hypothetical protein n=1 Tax=Staphylococcus aureus TaxID=1280 RepID=UPI0015BE92AF
PFLFFPPLFLFLLSPSLLLLSSFPFLSPLFPLSLSVFSPPLSFPRVLLPFLLPFFFFSFFSSSFPLPPLLPSFLLLSPPSS